MSTTRSPADTAVLAGTEHQPHARLVLGTGLATGSPSHAYLFHGPAGSGKRTAAGALAAELLADGAPEPGEVRRRVGAGTHPDLTWVAPSGAHVMRVADIEQPVVAAAGRTPFEARRRVFVLERVETMNDEVANRMLKTLEEPAHFVHILLLTAALGRVLPTVVSRCQLVRFDPLPAERIAARLESDGVAPERAAACARIGLGNAERARFLASEEGEQLRSDAERMVAAALAGARRGADRTEPWEPLLARAERQRSDVEKRRAAETAERLELEPGKGRERRAVERELDEAAKRDGRRARTESLELGLTLATICLRDLACVAEGAERAVLATDRLPTLMQAGAGRDSARLREAAERCEETRLSLQLNVTEELALSALFLRVEQLVGEDG